MNNEDYVSVVIVNWNGKKWLDKCLSSLLNQTYKKLEIILVDNASVDDSILYATENFPEVKIVKSKHNLGFSGGNNLGIKEAQGEYIILINSDIWVEEDFVNKLYNFYKKHDYDVIGPREKHYSGLTISDSYSPIDFLGNPAYSFVIKTKKLFALSGVCLFFKKDFYYETQGLDDDFFMYFEDVDWFWRLNLLKKKFTIAEGIFLYHYGSGSSTPGLNYNVFLWRNQDNLQMLIKNYSWLTLMLILPLYLFQNLLEIVFFILLLKPKLSYSYIQGWYFNIVNLGRTLKKREWIQSHRIAGDLEILRKMYLIPLRLIGVLNYLIR